MNKFERNNSNQIKIDFNKVDVKVTEQNKSAELLVDVFNRDINKIIKDFNVGPTAIEGLFLKDGRWYMRGTHHSEKPILVEDWDAKMRILFAKDDKDWTKNM